MEGRIELCRQALDIVICRLIFARKDHLNIELLIGLPHSWHILGIKDTDDFDPFKASIMAHLLQEDGARRIELTFLKELAGLLPKGNHIVAVNQ